MSTIRVAKRNRFTSIDRRTLNDHTISYRALGVLAMLLDKPDDWRVSAEGLSAPAGREGRDAVRAALRELVEAGYIRRFKYQDPATGLFVNEHVVYERPVGTETDAESDGGFPVVGATSGDATSALVDPTAAFQPTDIQPPVSSHRKAAVFEKTVTKDCYKPPTPTVGASEPDDTHDVASIESIDPETNRDRRRRAHATRSAATRAAAETAADLPPIPDDNNVITFGALRKKLRKAANT